MILRVTVIVIIKNIIMGITLIIIKIITILEMIITIRRRKRIMANEKKGKYKFRMDSWVVQTTLKNSREKNNNNNNSKELKEMGIITPMTDHYTRNG